MSKPEYSVILVTDEAAATTRMNELAGEGFEFLSMSSHGVASSQGSPAHGVGLSTASAQLSNRQATSRICIVMVKHASETAETAAPGSKECAAAALGVAMV